MVNLQFVRQKTKTNLQIVKPQFFLLTTSLKKKKIPKSKQKNTTIFLCLMI